MDFKKNPKTNFKKIDNLTKKEAKEEIEALREGIEYHDHLYYVKNQPKISDAVYDRLFRRLQELEETFPELQSDASPTRRVGAEPVDKLKKVKHAASMLSLNAVLDQKEAEEFDRFIRRNTDGRNIVYSLEPKFDGLSVEVAYKDGVFEYGATRGNGEVGEDISENLKTIHTVPLRFQKSKNIPSFVSVRGEVYMRKSGFQQLNRERIEKGDSPFANPRNVAAGMMRQLDPKNVSGKPLDIVFYDILRVEANGFSTHEEVLRAFSAWGLRTDPHNKRTSSFDTVTKYHKKLSEQRDDLDYEIDGVVIKVNNFEHRSNLGIRHRSPRWALAWKFPPKEEVTRLEDIVVQVGRTGMLTPVALLQPVDVGGVTVSRATLHNEQEARRKDVRIGDTVRIARAGDVIPEVVERVKEPGKKRGKPFSMPHQCPVCGAHVVREGAYTLCPAGLSCPAQQIGRIIHYGSRDAMNIEGLGDETVKDMVRKGLVQNMADLYALSVDDLLKLEGFAAKSAHQLHKAIQGSKNSRLDRFLYALGIRHVGQRLARVLAQKVLTLDALRKAKKTDLEEIPEIGPEIATSVEQFFRQKENKKVLNRLLESGVDVEDMPSPKKKTDLEGKTFVFTGTLDSYTRDEAEDHVELLGGRATSSLGGETDFVVAGKNPGSKLQEAKKQGTKIIDEKEFKKMIGES
jgi:DNA ligase (NAD+)